jgi:hypothetical protein
VLGAPLYEATGWSVRVHLVRGGDRCQP